ncbi:hypothetical protein [Streptomyces marispadix]|uniref:HEAT repeat domain-containing protein n=1 Tax=Streptomyces marispadix TaxID=2922868 RepID=A0ABS9SSB3_9ACTN|nr:hypothetical protein [Streptomyces marispadix]MCH6159157.1 hypothetical protein [Streptomyces marispadix]
MKASTYVGESGGPFHSGTGDQHNHYYPDIRDAVREKPERPPRLVAGDAVRHLKQRFVDPGGLNEGRRLLERSHVALLAADPGCGARSAAKILLWELPHGQERFVELLDQSEEEGGSSQALNPEHVKDGAPHLLDLTRARRDRYPVLMQDLSSLRVTVREKAARLAVVLSPEHRDLLSEELADLVVEIQRPRESDVLRRHLLVDGGIRPDSEDLAVGELSAFLASSSMGEISELARHVCSARSTSKGTHFKSWLDTALSAMRPKDADVDKLIADQTGPERALLLSVAFLEGASSQAIYGAANRLLKLTNHPVEHAPPLQHQPLAARLKRIQASAEGDWGRVRFDTTTFADAVRSYFWDNFPQLRDELTSWVRGAALFPHVEREDILGLVQRYAHLCLRTGLPEQLTALAEQWTKESATQAQLSMAARALGEGVIHPRHGSHFRREIYKWSRDGSLPRGRASVLIGVCSEALSVDFPQQALVRLHHVSHSADPQVRKIAREALTRITDSDDHLYGHLLDRLLDRVRADFEGKGSQDIGTFLDVADPGRLLEHAVGQARLTELWAAALSSRGGAELRPTLHSWLDHAASRAGPVSPIVSVLAQACARDGSTLGAVHDAAYGWAGTDGARLRVADALWSQATAGLVIHSSNYTC